MKKLICALLCTVLAAAMPAWAACTASSGPSTAALVELYTSEGCSSCPPADKRLSQYRAAELAGGQIVPIALHVDYWDYIGWKDRFAKAAFSERQNWLVGENHHRTVFTPHFFASGTEVQGWQSDLTTQIAAINARPSRAYIALDARLEPTGGLRIGARADSKSSDPLQLYLAVTEDALVSNVSAGENGGVTLHHDHVVREWKGPFPLADNRVTTEQLVALPGDAKRENIGVVAFVQDTRTGEVLQAVGANQCARS